MPNWVTNNIIVNNKKDFEKVKKLLLNENNQIDFNKLIPMPKDLEITCGGYTWETRDKFGFGGEILAKKIEFQNLVFEDYLNQFYTDTISQDDFVTCVRVHLDYVKPNYMEKLKEIYGINDIHQLNIHDSWGTHHAPFEELIRSFYNTKKYGYPNWYEWSCEQWGTKWNASETYVNENGVITFDTAWSCPLGIIDKLSKHVDFKIAYADEDLGSNYGVIEFKNGIGNRIEDLDGLEYNVAKYVATLIKGYECENYWYDDIEEDIKANDKEYIEQATILGKKCFAEIV